jgi:solute carrier family 25 carnitine/acylcarnitine transporter 20/29
MNIYHRHFTLVLIILYCGFINAKLGARDFMFCGGVSTAVTDFLLFPVDTIKVTQQNSHIGISIKEACHQIFNRGNGLGGFYKGALGYSLVDGCGSAVFFAVYEHVKGLAANHLSGPLLGASNYASAAAAFVASSIFLVPAEVLKTRMQTQSFDSIAICLRDSLTRERGGILGLYSGYKAALIRDLPYFALQLGFYGQYYFMFCIQLISLQVCA